MPSQRRPSLRGTTAVTHRIGRAQAGLYDHATVIAIGPAVAVAFWPRRRVVVLPAALD